MKSLIVQMALDAQSGLKSWVRNLAAPAGFIVLAPDLNRPLLPGLCGGVAWTGVVLVVEYKGKDYVSNDDSKEKKLLGEVWASKSNGRALFLMAVKKDERGRNVHEQIRAND